MRQILIVAALGLLATPAIAPAIAKERAKKTDSSKETAAAPLKGGTIKDQEARTFILQRLAAATGIKDWKIDLKTLTGSARNFVATSGSRQESGTVNVAKNYPNQGMLRVYLVPKD
jgi:hypothetical protein